MPFCPKCRYEYRDDVVTCPDCKVILVSLLPDERDDNDTDYKEYKDWVQIARLTSQQDAEMVEEGLKAKDIPVVVLSGAGYFGLLGQLGISSYCPVGGAYSVMIPREFVEDANREAEIILGDEWRKARLIGME